MTVMRILSIMLLFVSLAYGGVGEQQLARKETNNIEVYNNYLQGLEHYRRNTPDDWAKAVSYLETAIELDPNYGRAYALLARIYDQTAVLYMGWYSGKASALGVSYDEARALANKYLQKAEKHPTSLYHWLVSKLSLNNRNYEVAIAEAERGIALEPNNPDFVVQMAHVLVFSARPEAAVDYIKKAMQIDPNYEDPDCYYVSGMAHFAMKQLEESAIFFEKAHRRYPEDRWYAFSLATTYAHLGRVQEAQDAISKVTRGLYDYAVATVMVYMPFKDPETANRFADGLRKAGMK